MRWLFIDSSQPRGYRLGSIQAGQVQVRAYQGRSHQLVSKIFALQTRGSGSWDGICVVMGPGSFTSVRIGVLVANLLSRLWTVPLHGVLVEEAQNLDTLAVELQPSAWPVLPIYDAEPNITLPKIHGA